MGQQQQGLERRLARLDQIYTPKNKGGDFYLSTYSIYGNSLGSYHFPIKIEINMGKEEERKTSYKWNASHLKYSTLISKIKERWESLPKDMPFLGELRHVSRLHKWFSKKKTN